MLKRIIELTIFSASTVTQDAIPKTGQQSLMRLAEQAACNAKFAPTLLNGNLVKVSGIMHYNFISPNKKP